MPSNIEKTKNTAKKRVRYLPFSVIALIFALAFGGCAQLCTIRYYEPEIAFFSGGALLPKIMLYAVAALCAVYIIIGYILRLVHKDAPECYRHTRFTGLTLYSGLLSGFVLLASDVIFFIELYKSGKPLLMDSSTDIITVIMLALAIPAAFYFFSIAFGSGEKSKGTAVLGMFLVLWAAAYLLRRYFNMDTALTSPTRLLGQLLPLAIMCYFIQELRYRLGVARPALFRAYSSVAVLLTAVYAGIELTAAVRYDSSDSDRFFKLALICIGIYILFSSLHLPTARMKDPAADRRVLKERRRTREEDDDSYLEGLADEGAVKKFASVFEGESGEAQQSNESEPVIQLYKFTEEYTGAEVSDEADGSGDVSEWDINIDEVYAGDTGEAQTEQGVDTESEQQEASWSFGNIIDNATEQPISDIGAGILKQTDPQNEFDAERLTEDMPGSETSSEEETDIPDTEENDRRTEIRRELEGGAARRAETLISRLSEEQVTEAAEEDSFDTSCDSDFGEEDE